MNVGEIRNSGSTGLVQLCGSRRLHEFGRFQRFVIIYNLGKGDLRPDRNYVLRLQRLMPISARGLKNFNEISRTERLCGAAEGSKLEALKRMTG
jgi:hypothetical protein